jgi:hypothetical protein
VKAKRQILVALSIILGVAGVSLFIAAGLWALADRFVKSIDESPQRLIYHTDHAAVLQACRQVLADPQAFGIRNSAVNGLRGGGGTPAALPAAIRDLDFEWMSVEGDRAVIWFGSGFGHWGYSTAPHQGVSELKLIPGLWFWSEGRLPRDPSKFPYYRTSKRLLLGSIIAIAMAMMLMSYRWRIAVER